MPSNSKHASHVLKRKAAVIFFSVPCFGTYALSGNMQAILFR